MIKCKPSLWWVILLITIIGLGAARAAQDEPAFDVATLAAQSRETLPVGGSSTAELAAGASAHWWSVPLGRGDTIFIAANAATGTSLIPQLRLVSPAGHLVALDENPASSQNVLIRQFTALLDGTYYLEVSGLRQSGGEYTVLVGRLPATPEGQPTVTPLSSPAPTQVSDESGVTPVAVAALPTPALQGELFVGQVIEATLAVGERSSYTFEGAGGLPLRIDLVALDGGEPPVLDPYLELYGPGGLLLFENDDADYFQINARLDIRLPATGIYTLVVRSFGDGSGGPYRLSVKVGAMWQ